MAAREIITWIGRNMGKKASVAGKVARNKTCGERRAEEAARANERAAYLKNVVEAEWNAKNEFDHERFIG